VGRQRDVFSIDQVQQAAVVASPYQRRHGLATVVLVLPQGEIKVPFLPREHADELANRALFAAETALVHRV
jgi:putative membrane protein